MKYNKLHTPEGVRDILFEESALKEQLLHEIEGIFKSYAYQKIESPTFEYYDVFRNEWGRNKQEKLYNFFDRDGKILTLRPDLTAPALRLAATSLKHESYPLRLYYTGNSYRFTNPQKGNFREFLVTGVEFLGDDSPRADAEVIKIAIDSIKSAGIEEFQIELGQAEFFRAIAEEAELDLETIQLILQHIDQKNDLMLREIIRQHHLSEEIKRVLLRLPTWFGSIDILDEVEKWVKNKRALQALERLRVVYEILKMYGVEKYISIDLGMGSSFGYYTGIVFKGYTYGVGYSILSGGRYDELPKEFGLDVGAVGFGLKLDRLTIARKIQKIPFKYTGIEMLVGYDDNFFEQANEIAMEWRQKGKKVELNLEALEVEKSLEYAVKKNIPIYIHIGQNGYKEYHLK